jgi:hypothetical protein
LFGGQRPLVELALEVTVPFDDRCPLNDPFDLAA